MVSPPLPLAIALEKGLCKYVHLTMQLTIPPSTGGAPALYTNLPAEEMTNIKVDFPNFPDLSVIRALIAPPTKDYVWRTFNLVWGELYPAGITLDLVITHGQYGMILHEDPFVHSLVDTEYPHNLTLTKDKPEVIIIENNSSDSQTIDISIHLMAFSRKEDWDEYQNSILGMSTMPNGNGNGNCDIDLSTTNGILRAILKELKEGVRSVVTLWKKEATE